MPDEDAIPDAVAAWEAEQGRPWGDCGIDGCTDSHAHQPPPRIEPERAELDEPGPVIGYKIGDQVWDPADVTIIRGGG